jgi:hypothetical protein
LRNRTVARLAETDFESYGAAFFSPSVSIVRAFESEARRQVSGAEGPVLRSSQGEGLGWTRLRVFD